MGRAMATTKIGVIGGSGVYDIDGLEAAIGANTIGIVGSAPNWPYGHVDPIERLGHETGQR